MLIIDPSNQPEGGQSKGIQMEDSTKAKKKEQEGDEYDLYCRERS